MADFIKTKVTDNFVEEFIKLVNEFKNESDRAAVILGAAKLDILLYQLLSKFLIPNTTGNDELFDGDSPLSTFNAKINLAFRLGLIDKEFSRALHLIRKIRNSFAHEVSGVSLEVSGHSDRIRQLTMPLKEFNLFNDFRDLLFDGKNNISTDYHLSLTFCILRLETAITNTHQVKPIDGTGSKLASPNWDKITPNAKDI